MKNKNLAKSAKSRTPMQANYSPMKFDFLEKLIPSASTRDKIRNVGRKISDAYTYTKGVAKEIHRAKRPGESYNPLEAGERAVRAKKRGVNVKSAQAIAGKRNRPLKEGDKPTQTPQQMVKGYQKMTQKKKDAARNAAAEAKKKADKIAARKKFVKEYQSYNR